MRRAPAIEGPELRAGTWIWRAVSGDVEVRFTGRGPLGERERGRDEVLRSLEPLEGSPSGPPAPPAAWLRQIHSDRAVAASSAFPGLRGEGDGLFTSDPNLALCIATADCVPVLLASDCGRLAAIHAGWRGLANGVILSTLAAMGGPREDPRAEPRGDFRAWIGPAIGPCCYEVDAEVAEAVVAASGPEVAAPGPAGKPHLDLRLAARLQLARAGIEEVETVGECTRCETEKLHSYRREGKGGGRNLAFVWRR